MKRCIDCGKILPPQGRGHPRKKCPECSPTRVRNRAQPDMIRLERVQDLAGNIDADELAEVANPAGALEGAVRGQLEPVDRMGCIDAAAALYAARVLDQGLVTGAAQASLLREMRAAANDAGKGVSVVGKLDEIRRRRESKSS